MAGASVNAYDTLAGFRLVPIDEPQPDPAARELCPDGLRDLSTRPAFPFLVVAAVPSAVGLGSTR